MHIHIHIHHHHHHHHHHQCQNHHHHHQNPKPPQLATLGVIPSTTVDTPLHCVIPQTNEVSLSVTPVVAKTADRFGKMAVVLPGAVLCPLWNDFKMGCVAQHGWLLNIRYLPRNNLMTLCDEIHFFLTILRLVGIFIQFFSNFG